LGAPRVCLWKTFHLAQTQRQYSHGVLWVVGDFFGDAHLGFSAHAHKRPWHSIGSLVPKPSDGAIDPLRNGFSQWILKILAIELNY
jgi:hypothetical protein